MVTTPVTLNTRNPLATRSRARLASQQPPASPAESRTASWHVLLRYPRIRVYLVGSVTSNLGTWLQNTAQMLLMYQLTHSALAVGAITATQFLGLLVLGPWAGNLADLMGQKKVLVGSQLMSAAAAGALAAAELLGHLTEPELFYGALVTGLALTFALPVQSAMLSALVEEDDVKGAMAMNSVSYNIGRTLSPVLYLVVLLSIGAGWAFALNAISFLIFAVTVIAVYPRHAPRQVRPAPDWRGLRIAVRRPRITLLLAMVAAVTIADDPVQVLGPSLAQHVLHVSSNWPAYFLSALGLGTILGALVPTRPTTARRAAFPLAALAVFVVIFACGFYPWLSFTAAILAGMAALLTGASAQALLLTTAGPTSATQVMALWAVAWAGTKPFASLADGWLASNLGVFPAAAILAGPAILVAVVELGMSDKRKKQWKTAIHNYNRSHASDQTTPALQPQQGPGDSPRHSDRSRTSSYPQLLKAFLSDIA
jgi:MFS family permease